MCDNCKVKQRAIDVQRTVIDRQDAQIGRQQITLGELQTENLALRTTIAGIYEWMQTMIANAESELERREASILYMSDAGAA